MKLPKLKLPWVSRRRLEQSRAEVLQYAAAAEDARSKLWRATNSAANVEVAESAERARARSRQLERDVAIARKVFGAMTTEVVGTGIRPQITAGRQTWPARRGSPDAAVEWRVGDQVKVGDYAEWLFGEWTKVCDRSGRLDYYGIQSRCLRSMFVSGEVFVRKRRTLPEDGLIVPLQLQVIEADQLDAEKDGDIIRDGKRVGRYVQGVEYDLLDRVVAYWFLPEHPGEGGLRFGTARLSQSVRVDAADIIHLYDAAHARPGQARGMPWITASMGRIRDLDTYIDATLVGRQTAASLSVLVRSDDLGTETDDPADRKTLGKLAVDCDGQPVETLSPGLIAYLRHGEDVTVVQPAQAIDYDPFVKNTLRDIAAGTETPYEVATGDLSGTNYSSIQAGMNGFHDRFNALRMQVIDTLLNDRVMEWWLAMAVNVAHELPRCGYSVEWHRSHRDPIDRDKHESGVAKALQNRTTSYQREIRRAGDDPDKVFAELAQDVERLRAMGLVPETAPKAAGAAMGAASSDAAGLGDEVMGASV